MVPTLTADGGGFAHKVFIRELCVATGALGCALWDGGVVLARWIYENPQRFASLACNRRHLKTSQSAS